MQIRGFYFTISNPMIFPETVFNRTNVISVRLIYISWVGIRLNGFLGSDFHFHVGLSKNKCIYMLQWSNNGAKKKSFIANKTII